MVSHQFEGAQILSQLQCSGQWDFNLTKVKSVPGVYYLYFNTNELKGNSTDFTVCSQVLIKMANSPQKTVKDVCLPCNSAFTDKT